MVEKLICLLGRFQPWHNGHQKLLLDALKISDKVLIICGSSNLKSSYRNPWSFKQRSEYILACVPCQYRHRVYLLPLIDLLYDDNAWLAEINKCIIKAKEHFNLPENTEVAWIGHHKPDCDYLKILPYDKYFEIDNYENISASNIRASMLQEDYADFQKIMPKEMLVWLENNTKIPDSTKEPETANLIIVYKKTVMFLKKDGAYRLPGFICHKQDIANLVQAFIVTWYPLDKVRWGKSFAIENSRDADAEAKVTNFYVAYVDESIDDASLIWCDVNRFKTIDFWYNHASAALNVLLDMREK